MALTNVPVIFYATDEFKICDMNHDPFYTIDNRNQFFIPSILYFYNLIFWIILKFLSEFSKIFIRAYLNFLAIFLPFKYSYRLNIKMKII